LPSLPRTTPLGNFFGGGAVGVSELAEAVDGSRVSSAICSLYIENAFGELCARMRAWEDEHEMLESSSFVNAPAFAALTRAYR
jgi:hypothetical protein